MEMNDIFIMIFSMLLSFLMGAVGMLFFGGRTALNYLKVKVSRGRKVLIFAKTRFGWRSFVAKKKETTLKWKYDGTKLTTDIAEGSISRYLRLDMVFVDADKPARTISLKDGELYPVDFDPVVFNNLLIRAQTRPNVDGADELKKILMGILVLLLVVGFGVLMIYFKLSDLTVATGAVL